jgi:hypothetical protein
VETFSDRRTGGVKIRDEIIAETEPSVLSVPLIFDPT